jgi:hypothetical protein
MNALGPITFSQFALNGHANQSVEYRIWAAKSPERCLAIGPAKCGIEFSSANPI